MFTLGETAFTLASPKSRHTGLGGLGDTPAQGGTHSPFTVDARDLDRGESKMFGDNGREDWLVTDGCEMPYTM